MEKLQLTYQHIFIIIKCTIGILSEMFYYMQKS